MEKKLPPKTLMLGVSSSIDGSSPAKPCHEHGDRKANKGLAGEYEDEVDSWLSLDPDSDGDGDSNGYSCGEVDCGLDLKGCNSCFKNQCQVGYNPQQYHGVYQGNTASERVENTASERVESFPFAGTWEQQQEQQYWRNLGVECENVNAKAEAQFVHSPLRSQSVSALYMDDGVLLEATMSNVSDSYGRNSGWQFGTHSSTTLKMPPNFGPMNREAKVQRYREKRRKRNFEKTIRYASRQAYAETRPRVRGKFAREAEKEEIELDQMFSMDKNLP